MIMFNQSMNFTCNEWTIPLKKVSEIDETYGRKAFNSENDTVTSESSNLDPTDAITEGLQNITVKEQGDGPKEAESKDDNVN